MGDVHAASGLVDLLVGPVGLLRLVFTRQSVVLAQEETLDHLKSVVLSCTSISGCHAALTDVADGAGDQLVGNWDDRAVRVSNLVERGEPLSEVCYIRRRDKGARVGDNSVVVVHGEVQQTVHLLSQLVGNCRVLSVHHIQIQPSGRIRSDLESSVHHISTRAGYAHPWVGKRRERGERGVQSVVGLLQVDANEVVGAVGLQQLREVEISGAVHSHQIVGNELAHEGPQQIVSVRRGDSIVGAEQIVGHATHIGGRNRLANSIGVFYALGSSAEVVIGASQLGVSIVIASSVVLTGVEAIWGHRSGGCCVPNRRRYHDKSETDDKARDIPSKGKITKKIKKFKKLG